ncbi:MAG: hypothetical protein LQ351_005717 [Letrouitia transgressa]|nr:MAG: hypothetical protein LQ351_005717 [Letrouitia transgressa]
MHTIDRLVILVLLLTFRGVAPFKFLGRSDSEPNDLLQQDLDAFLTLPARNSAIYSRALQVLDSLQTSPTCNRLAASDLITSCQLVESPNSEALLEDLQSTYAAQLAICEISDVGLPIPSNCDTFALKVDRNKKKTLRKSQNNQRKSYKIDDKHQLSQCLQALESRPQHWTSYSNNRQNALIMCHAARIDIEKDNLIKLYTSMTETSSQANSALSQAVKDIHNGLMQREQFVLRVNSLQEKLFKDLESSSSAMKTFFNQMMENLSAVVQGTATKATSVLKDAQGSVENLNIALQKSNAESRDLSDNIGRMLQQAREGSKELATAQTQQRDKQRAVAVDISALQVSLATAFQDINNQLLSKSQRLEELNALISTLETTATALRLTQTVHAEEQKRQHDDMRTEVQITKALLADVTASATNLHELVHNFSLQFAQSVTHHDLSISSLGIPAPLLRFFDSSTYVSTTLLSSANRDIVIKVAVVLGTLFSICLFQLHRNRHPNHRVRNV